MAPVSTPHGSTPQPTSNGVAHVAKSLDRMEKELLAEKESLDRQVRALLDDYLKQQAAQSASSSHKKLRLLITQLTMRYDEGVALDRRVAQECMYQLRQFSREFQAIEQGQTLKAQPSFRSPSMSPHSMSAPNLKPLFESYSRSHESASRTIATSPKDEEDPKPSRKPDVLRPSRATNNSLSTTLDAIEIAVDGQSLQSPDPEVHALLNAKRKSIEDGISDEVSHKRSRFSHVEVAGPISVDRTITFEEVYEGGNADIKQQIVRYPDSPQGKYYILKCEAHKSYFGKGKDPIQGAAKHLAGSLHNMSRAHDVAVRTLGYHVVDCTEELASKNNRVVKATYPSDKKEKNQSLGELSASPSKSSHVPEASGLLITRPESGGLYYAYWPQDGKYYLVMVLHWSKQPQCGLRELEGSLWDIGLLKKKFRRPACYLIDYSAYEIVGWAKGYEDDGPCEHDREFPVVFFQEPYIQSSWVEAQYLRAFDPDDPKYDDPAFAINKKLVSQAIQAHAMAKGFASYEDLKQANLSHPPTRAALMSKTAVRRVGGEADGEYMDSSECDSDWINSSNHRVISPRTLANGSNRQPEERGPKEALKASYGDKKLSQNGKTTTSSVPPSPLKPHNPASQNVGQTLLSPRVDSLTVKLKLPSDRKGSLSIGVSPLPSPAANPRDDGKKLGSDDPKTQATASKPPLPIGKTPPSQGRSSSSPDKSEADGSHKAAQEKNPSLVDSEKSIDVRAVTENPPGPTPTTEPLPSPMNAQPTPASDQPRPIVSPAPSNATQPVRTASGLPAGPFAVVAYSDDMTSWSSADGNDPIALVLDPVSGYLKTPPGAPVSITIDSSTIATHGRRDNNVNGTATMELQLQTGGPLTKQTIKFADITRGDEGGLSANRQALNLYRWIKKV